MTAIASRGAPALFLTRSARMFGARRLSQILVSLVLLLQLYPLFWIITASLRTARSFETQNPFSVPTHLTL